MTIYSSLPNEALAQQLRQTELSIVPYHRRLIVVAILTSLLLHLFVFKSHYLTQFFAGLNRFALNGNETHAPLLIKATLLPRPVLLPPVTPPVVEQHTTPLQKTAISTTAPKKIKKLTPRHDKTTEHAVRPARLKLPAPETLLNTEEKQFASLKETAPIVAETNVETTQIDSVTPTDEKNPAETDADTTKKATKQKEAAPISPKTAAALPAQLKLEYQLNKGNGLIMGRASYVLHIDPKEATYTLSSTMEASGVFSLFIQGKITQTSRGIVTTAGFRPDFYQIERHRGPKKTVDDATFQWQLNELHIHTNDELRVLKLPVQTQDYLTFACQLGFLLAKNQTEYTIPVTNGKKLETYRFQVVGTETITIPAGDFETIHLKKMQDSANEEATEMWLDLKHPYQLIKLRQINRQGDIAEQILTKLPQTDF